MGFTAQSTLGWATIQIRPVKPMVMNQTSMIGPKTLPTRAVPWLWKRKSMRSVITVSQTTAGLKADVTTTSPS